MLQRLKAENRYSKVIEHFACRNFNIGDRVKAYFNGEWVHGVVVKKYNKENGKPPYILIKTDKKVDSESDALLDGFGLEGRIDEPCTIFEYEPLRGDELYTGTYERDMTEEEMKEDIPF